MVLDTSNPSTQQTEAGRLLRVQSQLGLQNEFKTNLRWTLKLYQNMHAYIHGKRVVISETLEHSAYTSPTV